MSWKYENLQIDVLYNKIHNTTYDNPILKNMALKAFNAAQIFEKYGMNEELVVKHLTGKLECGPFSELFFATSYQNTKSFSRSHYDWLYELNVTKLKWDWYPELQKTKLQTLMEKYQTIQELALSYHDTFIDKENEL
jgi:hypothetical protein